MKTTIIAAAAALAEKALIHQLSLPGTADTILIAC
jgi:hypothetical protein